MNRKPSAVSYQRSGGAFGVLRPDAAMPLGGLTPASATYASQASRHQSGVKPPHSIVAALALVVLTSATFAATLVSSSVDAGGQRSTSASYVNDGSVGWIGGVSSAISPPETMKHGFIGQLYEVAGLAVTGTPSSVNEGSTSQLSGTAALDDATVLALAGSDITWGATAWPIHAISSSGVATTENVYADTPTTINGSYLGVAGSGSLLVLDSNPDNYASYANDGLPDSWQVQYFGLNNPNAAPNVDADGTGQNNLFKYVAGLDPTNANSVFRITSAAWTKNNVAIMWKTAGVRTNVVQGSVGTATGGYTNNFYDVSDSIIISPTGDTTTNYVDQSRSNRYYRIRLVP